jgi:Zn ribbon nucleic-acid-binding protein
MYGFVSSSSMPDPTCKHKRTQLIAKDDESQYVECLDCGELFEAAELKAEENKKDRGFGESLSDA